MKTDFISIEDHSREWIETVYSYAKEIKESHRKGLHTPILAGKVLLLLFQKPSMRTRVSFEIGMSQLGGHAVYLSPDDIAIGAREATKDIARVGAGMADGIMARLFAHADVVTLAEYSQVPVINGLTDLLHPCQILADHFTFWELRGRLDEFKIAFIGDGNNVAHSWIHLAQKFSFHLCIACPEGYEPAQDIVEKAAAGPGTVEILHDPKEAAQQADILYTDVWTSMGDIGEETERLQAFAGFQINADLLRQASKDCMVMHCLPAHRGEEITDDVLESDHSVVFQEAENRLHLQKGLLAILLKE